MDRTRRSSSRALAGSPPTRGWTTRVEGSTTHPDGFPAHAGMDRHEGSATAVRHGFPRPRGDGPLRKATADRCRRVSPPTRGWTLSRRHSRRQSVGFPAHAGMDPRWQPRTRCRYGFPRPRGDGPARGSGAIDPGWVSPPTRGWTPLHQGAVPFVDGFPAHAGMDLEDLPELAGARRFPRPRGDGPQHRLPRLDELQVSPPTRGWTCRRRKSCPLGGGFPAHAGMDPVMLTGVVGGRWFPRPRGDGPLAFWIRLVWMEVSPPTRGWTQPRRRIMDRLRGFPAHAGMDPPSREPRAPTPRFPRPRGDGPTLHQVVEPSERVSPPTRGWTSGDWEDLRDAAGFPAHAGMDP